MATMTLNRNIIGKEKQRLIVVHLLRLLIVDLANKLLYLRRKLIMQFCNIQAEVFNCCKADKT